MPRDPRLHELLERIGAVLAAAERASAARDGLQPVHLRVLDYLGRCNRFSDTPAAVTAYLRATKGTVSQSIRLLEERGLIRRAPDRVDGRVTHLSLTADGRRALRAHRPPAEWSEASARIPAAARERLVEDLDTVLRALQADGRSFGVCRSCRHLETEADRFRCGLNGATLSPADTTRICVEHETPAA